MPLREPHDLLSGADRSWSARSLRAVLGAVEPLYGAVVRARAAAYDTGWCAAHPLGRPTVSVGNLIAGGTGKTPLVIEICRRLRARGCSPAVLTRGYHGGDEAQEMTAALQPPLLVTVNPDRRAGAAAALAADPGIGAFVLDDGFQHRRAARDLDLVLIDATNPWGHGHLLPRGLLREPRRALRRADAVLLTRVDRVPPAALDALRHAVQAAHGRPPLAELGARWGALRCTGVADLPVTALAGRRAMAVTGLGRPEAFEAMLAEEAGTVVAARRFGDHHAFTVADLTAIGVEARAQGAEAVVTSEKDFVKWAPLLATWPQPFPLPVWRPVLTLAFHRGEAAFDTLLASLFAPAASVPGAETRA